MESTQAKPKRRRKRSIKLDPPTDQAGWAKVEDATPCMNVDVLALTIEGEMTVAQYVPESHESAGAFWLHELGRDEPVVVTHWRPLPPLPSVRRSGGRGG